VFRFVGTDPCFKVYFNRKKRKFDTSSFHKKCGQFCRGPSPPVLALSPLVPFSSACHHQFSEIAPSAA